MSTASPEKKQESTGAPAWVMTFADLMSLLMCFFVLLLSFSEMDLLKFKQVAGSMEQAFGVQRMISAKESPKGTSIIAKEFSPGRPTPTPLKQLRQYTIDDTKETLRSFEEQSSSKEIKDDLNKLSTIFAEEIAQETIHLEAQNGRVMIRIREKGSFPSGSSVVKGSFLPVLDKLKKALKLIDGKVAIAGHTDNVPIKTAQFQSNWALSAARAVAVTHALLEESDLASERFIVEGYADVRPLADNITAEDRALNRRVEITIIKSDQDEEIIYKSGNTIIPLNNSPDYAEGIDEKAAIDTAQQDIIGLESEPLDTNIKRRKDGDELIE